MIVENFTIDITNILNYISYFDIILDDLKY